MQEPKARQQLIRQTDRFLLAMRRYGKQPGKKSVHHLRSETARLRALLHLWTVCDDLRPTGANPQHAGMQAVEWRGADTALTEVRHFAGQVRDLDVQRKLLKGFADSHLAKDSDAGRKWGAMVVEIGDRLKHRRKKKSKHLTAYIRKHEKGIAADLARMVKLAGEDMLPEALTVDPLLLAQSTFADAVSEFTELGPENLHEFRKRCRRARYLAELAEGPVGGRSEIATYLKEIQGAIGVWHDHGLLLRRTRKSKWSKQAWPGDHLVQMIEGRRSDLYSAAILTVERLRPRIVQVHATKLVWGRDGAAQAER